MRKLAPIFFGLMAVKALKAARHGGPGCRAADGEGRHGFGAPWMKRAAHAEHRRGCGFHHEEEPEREGTYV